MSTLTSKTHKVVMDLPTEPVTPKHKVRGRLAARFRRGMSLPVVTEGSVKNRLALFSIVSPDDIAWYDVRAEAWTDGKFASAKTSAAFPKAPANSVGVGNSCTTTVRAYLRTYGECDPGTWEGIRVVSLADDSPLIGFVWVEG